MNRAEPHRTAEGPPHLRRQSGPPVVPVFFISDSTGISAETLGNALLIQFPDMRFDRRLFPFVTTIEEARRVVEVLDRAVKGPVMPLAFSTLASNELRNEVSRTTCPLIDLFESHLPQIESVLGHEATHVAARLHGLGDVKRYNHRMSAIEYTIEHDDGQSLRALDKADVILVGPSRCGKTPTSMYLALQHGLFVANYPLVEDDFEGTDLPMPVRAHRRRCFGLVTTADRLAQVRQQRRPNSRYASMEQCTYELRRAEALFRSHHIPSTSSATKSVEEIATVIMQTIHRRRP